MSKPGPMLNFYFKIHELAWDLSPELQALARGNYHLRVMRSFDVAFVPSFVDAEPEWPVRTLPTDGDPTLLDVAFEYRNVVTPCERLQGTEEWVVVPIEGYDRPLRSLFFYVREAEFETMRRELKAALASDYETAFDAIQGPPVYRVDEFQHLAFGRFLKERFATCPLVEPRYRYLMDRISEDEWLRRRDPE